jgi:hypothetical protein
MGNPLQRLKYLPWRSLFLLSSLIAVIVTAIDFLVVIGYNYSPVIQRTLTLLYTPPMGTLVDFAFVVGIGALAVYLLENFYRLSVNTAVLWALVLCLAVCLVIKSLLPLPDVLVKFNEIQLMGIAIGVFWKGRPYWR